MPYADYQKTKRHARARYWENREAILSVMRLNYAQNRGRILERNREWRRQNADQCVKHAVEYEHNRRKTDVSFRLRKNLRARIQKFVSGVSKAATSRELLGCDVDFLRGYLSVFFKPGMTWENYGKVWHIDHKRPCASFDLTNLEQQKQCFHWTNLQPLFARENLQKGARV